MDRKRRIEQLVGHLESKLEVKRRKLSRLHEELRQLENFQIDPSLVPILSPLPVDQSTPISKRSSSIFAKNAQQLQDQSTLSVDTSLDTSCSSPLVVSLPLSPSRKSSRLQAANPVVPSQSVVSGRKEAGILARVTQLQKEGKWTSGKKLAKVQPPSRPKTHWDFVIEEMTWMSGIFQQEMKIKKANAKKCVRMVQKHFSDKALAIQRAERAHEQQLRRIASNMAKEVRGFWGNIEKLFEFRLKSQIEKKRKIAMDEHLNFIVDKTEKYSTLLAESMAESASLKTTPTASDSEMGGHMDDDDYQPDQNSDDDEATIAKEEDDHEDDELDLLKEDSEIPVEELLRLYHPELYGSPQKAEPETKVSRRERTEKPKEVVGEKSSTPDESEENKSKAEENDDQEEDDDDDDDDEGNDEGDDEDDDEEEDEKEGEEGGSGLKALVTGNEEKFSDVIEMAAKFQPTGNTLDTTNVKTKVPFLLKGTLREYQHIGLDWLYSLHERKLNGILADEMGLGKTIQTISLLCHLACEKHVWGPHLIVVPTSVMLNWEMELKKWAPAFKVLTYYGSQKERRLKRVGWTKPNAFHVCITSYKLVIQDHQSFRRKRWQYLILDEAQHIKNFKSQRWQLLLNFVSEGRLLLTGTPLQNNLMELWSLMHFLMPNVFESHRDFKEWFSNPLTGMVEGSAEYNESLIQRLHKVLRPFLLRRLKSEVEKQMPKKYEHIVKCPLSKRQRYLYDDFMSRAKTKETLEGGNLLSVINVLMQLRKVCNHPNLFEPRATVAPFVADPIQINLPRLVTRALDYDPFNKIDLTFHPLSLTSQEFNLTAYACYRLKTLRTIKTQFQSCIVKGQWKQSVACPRGKLRLHVKVGPAPPMPKTDAKIPLQTVIDNNLYLKPKNDITIRTPKGVYVLTPRPELLMTPEKTAPEITRLGSQSPNEDEAIDLQEDDLQDPEVGSEDAEAKKKNENARLIDKRLLRGIFSSSIFSRSSESGSSGSGKKSTTVKALPPKLRVLPQLKEKRLALRQTHVEVLSRANERRCTGFPLYGSDVIQHLRFFDHDELTNKLRLFTPLPALPSHGNRTVYSASYLAATKEDLVERLNGFASRFQLFVSPCVVHLSNPGCDLNLLEDLSTKCESLTSNPVSVWTSRVASQHLLQLPETRLIQYDCGKLQILGRLLHTLKEGSHRVLLFTQMTKVLDVLESFMNFQGHTYLRLDGSTKIEQRQVLMERFNANSKYFCFILSTRSGGVGVNLTGADTVIFYDSDWNPTMDAQAQDRCHRIGQTRDVHIYRLVSERSVEENILKKANQKRLLGDIAIEGGNFTTAHFKKSTIRDLFDVQEESTLTEGDNVVVDEADEDRVVANGDEGVKKKINLFESALTAVEENTDVEALNLANQEAQAEEAEFDEDGEKEDDKFGHLMKQLSAVERYALSQVEFYEGDWKREQLAAADAQIEAQRREFDARKLEELAVGLSADASSAANSTTGDEDADESGDDNGGDTLGSPRTRSRVEVSIDLWKLDKNKRLELKKL